MKTTINLRFVDLPVLENASTESGLSRSELIVRCLKMLYVNERRLRVSRIGRLVEYQPRFAGYKISHIDFDAEKYNFNVNFRLFARCSVSLLVTLAISLYLNDVINDRDVVISQDNYLEYKHEWRHNLGICAEEWAVTWNVRAAKGS